VNLPLSTTHTLSEKKGKKRDLVFLSVGYSRLRETQASGGKEVVHDMLNDVKFVEHQDVVMVVVVGGGEGNARG